MTFPAVPSINGYRYSFASIECVLNGTTFRGFSEISYTESLEPGEVRGTASTVLGFTIGDYKVEGSLGIYVEEFESFIQLLGDGFMVVQFPISVTFSSPTLGTVTDNIRGVRIKNGARSFQKGTDGLTVKCDFVAIEMDNNGIHALPIGTL